MVCLTETRTHRLPPRLPTPALLTGGIDIGVAFDFGGNISDLLLPLMPLNDQYRFTTGELQYHLCWG